MSYESLLSEVGWGYNLEWAERLTGGAAMRSAESTGMGLNNKLGGVRVAAASVVSSGLYLFYWFYLTWKQLKIATNRQDYHPVWHALALLVPIYGLVIAYRHMRIIKDLATDEGVTTSLSPGGALTLLIVGGVLANASVRASLSYGELGVGLILDILSVAILAGMLLWGQTSLNKYWNKISEAQVREARIGVGEVVIIVVGLLIWFTYLL